ncbi:variant erythrocyte surface antigen alpha subunit, putative [Babesia ovis]|uniref:Variant erythrocyte surface antigen alpha subunit, putative n=1 Tax=Babesia ovis TaxID=5869 RepID=A0A9W5TDI5_BABOV|nr:variant erythrocyte surface antigen alpha subunit, putative [Babesia ovis]
MICTHNVIGIESYKLKNYGNDVPIHDLYANMQFYFSYPMSETQSYYLLQDCLVALYYQMYFLWRQCNLRLQYGYGWSGCGYGYGVDCKNCKSWQCPKVNAAEVSKAYAEALQAYNAVKHKTDEEKKKVYDALQNVINQQKCGKTENGQASPSPLQAFLTDCLPGFTCKEVKANMEKYCKEQSDISKNYSKCYMEFLQHRTHLPVGQYCPIPMGFRGSFKGAPAPAKPGTSVGMSGLGINAITANYANDDLTDSCLYQVTRCISSLTRRVPRSTGTLFGFFHGLGHVLFYSSSKAAMSGALKDEMERCPGSSNSKELLDAIKDWRGSSHKQDNCITLDSIQNCNSNGQKGQTCGKYFQPLTGSLYNSMATQFCETYVSWIVHLTWRLRDGLESLLKEFKMIQCSKDICKGRDGKTDCKCPAQGCNPGTHGTTPSSTTTGNCCCHSVVHCAGVLGLFYRFGFTYGAPNSLSGRKENQQSYDESSRRQCHDFYKQLEAVIGGTLFTKVLDDIRRFLYTTRLPFSVFITGFWSIVLGYLLWSMTVNLDLMHIRSHWRSPGSYLVPLQRILADGSRKGFCTLGYFQEGTGDRLLSEGISDVYL